ncbi:MAG: IS1380 family transposase [Methylococcales bacterium]
MQAVQHILQSFLAIFKLKQSRERFTNLAGLALVGLALEKFARVLEVVDRAIPKRSGLTVGEIVTAYVGLLCTGKSDFDAIENHRQDGFFAEALGLEGVPAASTLRMQLDAQAEDLLPVTSELSVGLLQRSKAPITPLACGLVALDIDVFTQDNGRTKKEGVSRTYAGTDGFAPIAAYLGQEGWCLALELRDGCHFSSRETEYTLERVLPRATALTDAGILVRWDSGFHAARLAMEIETASLARQAAGGQPIHFLVKGNPRGLDIVELHAQRQDAIACIPREGKRAWIRENRQTTCFAGKTFSHRRIHRLIERTIEASGQTLIFPEIEYDFWDTTLPQTIQPSEAIRLYEDHGTHEQFHSAFKTDLDLERFPSGKFATNDLILSMATLAYNVLRLMGILALLDEAAPVRHPAKRRRLKTVMQELIYVSAKLIAHARRKHLSFGYHCPAFGVFRRLYLEWSTA